MTVIFEQPAKITSNKKNTLIFIPQKIARKMSKEQLNKRALFQLHHDGSIEISFIDENSIPYERKPDKFQEKILYDLKAVHNKQIENMTEVNEIKNEIEEGISSFKEILKTLHSVDLGNAENKLEENQDEKLESIDIIPKNPEDYKYIARYYEQNVDTYKKLDAIVEEKGYDSFTENTPLYGYNIKSVYGDAHIVLDSPIDWEDSSFKGERSTSIAEYFNPHIYTYVVENGEEKRISWYEFMKHIDEALLEFISLSGIVYRVTRSEIWFHPYHSHFEVYTFEEIFSKKLHQRFINGEIDDTFEPDIDISGLPNQFV